MFKFNLETVESKTLHSSVVPPEAGEYTFQVVGVVDRTREKNNAFRSGNEGQTVELAVDVGGGKTYYCHEHNVNTPAALWKVKAFCDALGVTTNTPGAKDFLEKWGRAEFKIDDRNRLRVGKYFPGTGEKP